MLHGDKQSFRYPSPTLITNRGCSPPVTVVVQPKCNPPACRSLGALTPTKLANFNPPYQFFFCKTLPYFQKCGLLYTYCSPTFSGIISSVTDEFTWHFLSQKNAPLCPVSLCRFLPENLTATRREHVSVQHVAEAAPMTTFRIHMRGPHIAESAAMTVIISLCR